MKILMWNDSFEFNGKKWALFKDDSDMISFIDEHNVTDFTFGVTDDEYHRVTNQLEILKDTLKVVSDVIRTAL